MKFNERLMQLRKERGWSQEELAAHLDVTRQTVSKWELGTTTPEMSKLIEMSRLFAISLDMLVADTDAEPQSEQTTAMPEEKQSLAHRLHFEYKSKRHIGKLPLVHVNIGLLPCVAKGVFAIGNIALGICSLGLLSAGVLSFGILAAGLLAHAAISVGVISFGGISAGVVAFGGIALGVITVGGLSCGVYAMGGLATASQIAFGGFASAPVAIGDAANGTHTFLINESTVTYAEVEAAILSECPHTPGFIKHILEMLLVK